MTPDKMWDLVIEGSDELGDELGVDPAGPPASVLDAVDAWIAGHDDPLDDNDVGRLGCLLARVLIERHGGGLARIEQDDHPLDGEWTVTGFSRGLGEDYHVPCFVSAWRIAADRSLTARSWYAQLRREGRGAPSRS